MTPYEFTKTDIGILVGYAREAARVFKGLSGLLKTQVKPNLIECLDTFADKVENQEMKRLTNKYTEGNFNIQAGGKALDMAKNKLAHKNKTLIVHNASQEEVYYSIDEGELAAWFLEYGKMHFEARRSYESRLQGLKDATGNEVKFYPIPGERIGNLYDTLNMSKMAGIWEAVSAVAHMREKARKEISNPVQAGYVNTALSNVVDELKALHEKIRKELNVNPS